MGEGGGKAGGGWVLGVEDLELGGSVRGRRREKKEKKRKREHMGGGGGVGEE